MIALFSGRFDPPNLGHVLTVMRLLKSYDCVVLCVLSWDKREGCSARICVDIFNTFLKLCGIGNKSVKILTCKYHFGYITRKQLENVCKRIISCVGGKGEIVYVGGNSEVNEYIKKMNYIKVIPTERVILYNGDEEYSLKDQYIFESTEIRKKIENGESLEDQYNIKL